MKQTMIQVSTLDLDSILESTVKRKALLFIVYYFPNNMCATKHMCTLILISTKQLCCKTRTLLFESHSLNSEESSRINLMKSTELYNLPQDDKF